MDKSTELSNKIDIINSKTKAGLPSVGTILDAFDSSFNTCFRRIYPPISQVILSESGDFKFHVSNDYLGGNFLCSVTKDNIEDVYDDFISNHFEFMGILEEASKNEEIER